MAPYTRHMSAPTSDEDPSPPQPLPQRKHLRRRETGFNCRLLTFSCYHQFQLFGKPAIRDVFMHALARARDKHGFELFAWVDMPEHVHLLVRPQPDQLWHPIAAALKTSVARTVVHRWRTLRAPILPRMTDMHGKPRFWQRGGGFDRNVRSMAEFTREVRYIHRNPVAAELVARPEEWPHSSVHWWMGRRDGPLPCDPPPDPTYAWHLWQGYV